MKRGGPLKRRTPLRDSWQPSAKGHRGQPCQIDGCARPNKARGLCAMHYQRWKNHGDPEATEFESRVDLTCERCGRPFSLPASAHRLRPQRHCSQTCGRAALRERRDERRKDRTKVCAGCGSEFVPYAWAVGRTDAGKFCGRACYDQWRAAQPRAVVTHTCPVCGVEFQRPRAWGSARFCSRSCHALGRVRPGSTASRGAGWRKIATAIRERDGRRCVRCDAPEDKRQHSVDHIVPWILTRTAEALANHPDNLASLCSRCHGRKTAYVEPRMLRGDWLALTEFYGQERAARAMARVEVAA